MKTNNRSIKIQASLTQQPIIDLWIKERMEIENQTMVKLTDSQVLEYVFRKYIFMGKS